jgi:hypothetical protein
MSQTETNEILNPTKSVVLPLQSLTEESTIETKLLSNSTYVPGSHNMLDPQVVQMTPSHFAAKQKRIGTITMSTTNQPGDVVYTLNITPNLFRTYYALPTVFNLRNHDISIHVKPVANAMFQGFYRAVFDPAPSDQYYRLFGNSLNYKKSFQLTGFALTGNSAEVLDMFIPKHYPFNYFFQDIGVDTPTRNYIRGYRMGTLRIFTINKLATTGTIQTMEAMISLALPNMKYGATRFAPLP